MKTAGDLAPLTALLVSVLTVCGIVALAILGKPIPEVLVFVATAATGAIFITSGIRGSVPPPKDGEK